MGKSKYRYLIGTVVNGDWLVTGVDEWDKYICKCTHCGKTKKMRGGPLANGTARRCLCIEPPAIGFVDLTGRDFGQWHVEGYAGDGKWYCECSCGQARIIPGYTLKNGGTTSCGHKEDMIGQIFDDWEVIGEGKKQGYALCKCSCGAVKEVQKYSLRKGISKSCGHATTGLKDLTVMKINEWEVSRRLDSKGNYECKCSCVEIRTVTGYALRNGSSKSCGHKANEFRKETCKIMYGVPVASQRTGKITLEQIDSTSTLEKVIAIIDNIEKEKDGRKPTIFDFCKVTGMDRGSAHYFLEKRGLLDRFSINSNASHYEDELNELFPGAEKRVRILDGAEIDIYFPNYSFGIEFNGNHWHNSSKRKKNYHKEKSLKAFKKGIDIFHVFEYEWNDPYKHDKLVQEISRKIHLKPMKTVNIDGCIIRMIGGDESDAFFRQYSLKDDTKNTLGIAVYSEGECIAVLGFKYVNDLGYQWEMTGIAYADGYDVDDLKPAFDVFIQEKNPDNIVIYCDFSKDTGRAYEKLGFKRCAISEPNFVKYDEYLQDVTSLKVTDKNDLESKGCLLIYDCGTLRLALYK